MTANTVWAPSLGVALFLFFQALLVSPSAPVLVLANDRPMLLPALATVDSALMALGMERPVGDLVDVDGGIVRRGAGWTARAALNGRVVPTASLLSHGDRLEAVAALDRTERVETEVVEVILADQVEGEGEYTTVRAVGVAGKKLIVRGARSGKIVSIRNLSEARPFIIARTADKPDKPIALTFDDGPTPPYTNQITEILSDLYGTGTFFVLGSQAALFSRTVQDLDAAGFQVANHTYSHSRLDGADEATVIQELDAASSTIVPLIGKPMRWFRPPYGSVSDSLRVIAARRGYHTVRWHIDSRDWDGLSPEAIAERVLAEARPGAIVLLHDGGGDRTNTVKALPHIIKELYERGFSLVTVEQLAK